MEDQHSSAFEAASQPLLAEEQRLIREVEAISTREEGILLEKKEKLHELKHVRTILSALRGDSHAQARVMDRDSQGGPTLRSEASRMVEEILSSNAGPMQLTALKARVLEHCHELNIRGTGVGKVLRRVLAEDRFVQSTDGYALRKTAG
jgi:hypothetical protein